MEVNLGSDVCIQLFLEPSRVARHSRIRREERDGAPYKVKIDLERY